MIEKMFSEWWKRNIDRMLFTEEKSLTAMLNEAYKAGYQLGMEDGQTEPCAICGELFEKHHPEDGGHFYTR